MGRQSNRKSVSVASLSPELLVVVGDKKSAHSHISDRCKECDGKTVGGLLGSGYTPHLLRYDLDKQYLRLVDAGKAGAGDSIVEMPAPDVVINVLPPLGDIQQPGKNQHVLERTCSTPSKGAKVAAFTPSTQTPQTMMGTMSTANGSPGTDCKRKLRLSTSDPIDADPGRPSLPRKRLGFRCSDAASCADLLAEDVMSCDPVGDKGSDALIVTPKPVRASSSGDRLLSTAADSMEVAREQHKVDTASATAAEPASVEPVAGAEPQTRRPDGVEASVEPETVEALAQEELATVEPTVPAAPVVEMPPHARHLLQALECVLRVQRTSAEASGEPCSLPPDLTQASGSDVPAHLLKLLEHKKASVRRDSFQLLQAAKFNEQAASVCLKLLRDPSPVLKNLALEALPTLEPHLPTPLHMEQIIQMLDESETVAWNAQLSLVAMRKRLSTRDLCAASDKLHSQSAGTRCATVALFASIGADVLRFEAHPLVTKVLSSLLRLSPGDGAAQALSKLRAHGLSLQEFGSNGADVNQTSKRRQKSAPIKRTTRLNIGDTTIIRSGKDGTVTVVHEGPAPDQRQASCGPPRRYPGMLRPGM